MMRSTFWILILLAVLLVSCAPVDLDAAVPVFETGVDADAWVTIPAGGFLSGQFAKPVVIDADYQIMVTDVTVSQYVDFLNQATADGTLTTESERITGSYPGDPFSGAKHELQIDAGQYIFIPLNDPASRFALGGRAVQEQTWL